MESAALCWAARFMHGVYVRLVGELDEHLAALPCIEG